MILMKDIIREGNELLRKKSEKVKTPLSDEDKNLIMEMLGFLFNSQNKELAEKYGLRPGVGLAAPQLGINKQIFTILANDEDGKMWLMAIVNPKIVKASTEMVYLPGGEGCLSVDRETCDVTPRHKYITIEADFYIPKTKKLEHKKINLKDYIAIVFQHEYDHLLGTLYVDTMLNEKEARKRDMKPLWETE